MRAWVAVIMALSLVFSARSGLADEDVKSRQDRAKAFWDEGARQYDLGKFDDAIEDFVKAYEIWPFAPILFNLCQAYRQKSDYKKAVFYCKAYLRNLPEAKNRTDVEDLVIDMEKTLDQQKATNERPPEGIAHPVPRGLAAENSGKDDEAIRVDTHGHASSYRPWKWITFISGGAAIATGVTLIAIDEDQISADGTRRVNYHDTMTEGLVVTATGAALVAIGGVLWTMEKRSHRRNEPAHAVSLAPTSSGGLVFTLTGSF